ncbi:hypothetical protein [Weissella paramesenteroides]|uniref:hypothetical protein n=1 Tax=Weissella paramesenteroides TaxID=1249 RepID=UPI0013D9421E|nr:hypothetical protein [Weissella paramesenteroides]NEZ89050.1 hypothetical protein [Weissella paramesenteroides]NFB03375.1 hypothetical protein [Weissella paramesenteroides]
MIQTQVITPEITYQLLVQQTTNQANFSIFTPAFGQTTTFSLMVSDWGTARYFTQYLASIIALTFQKHMSNTVFLSKVQNLINNQLANWLITNS